MSDNLDPKLVGLIAAFGNAAFDVAAFDASFDAGHCTAGDTDAARLTRDQAKQELYNDLKQRAARHRRADELLAQCAKWFEQNEAKLAAAGIGGFRFQSAADSEK